eukprot:37790-Prymnesium_polylepis.1
MCQGRSDREPASRGGESRCARQIVEHGRSRTNRREIRQGLALQTSVSSSAPRHHDQVVRVPASRGDVPRGAVSRTGIA